MPQKISKHTYPENENAAWWVLIQKKNLCVLSACITNSLRHSLGQIANVRISPGVGVSAERNTPVGGVTVDATSASLEALRVHSRERVLVTQAIKHPAALVRRAGYLKVHKTKQSGTIMSIFRMTENTREEKSGGE